MSITDLAVEMANAMEDPDTEPEEDEPSDGQARPHFSGWHTIHSRLKKFDKATIDGHKADIDNLLLFASLFSAVLTSFVVETYTQLRPDNSQQLSTAILLDILKQLQNPSIESSTSSISLQPPPASFAIVAVNTLWFMSLILSLSSVLLGISVKEWLEEYLNWITVHPVEHAVQIRQLRYEALLRWRVPAIATILPGLLQLALVLFFGGLVALLWSLNVFVSICVISLVAVTLVCYILTVGISLIHEDCPYKTPIAWLLHSVILWSVTSVASIGRSGILRHSKSRLPDEEGFRGSRQPEGRIERLRHLFETFYSALEDRMRESYGTWVRRDLAVHAARKGPAYVTSWMCRCLLWACAHENLDDDLIRRCTKHLSVTPRWMSTVKRSEDERGACTLANWPDNPHKRLCGIWFAISDTLHDHAHPTFRSKTAYDHLREKYEATSLHSNAARRYFNNITGFFQDEMQALSIAQKHAMFWMLHSSLTTILNSGAPCYFQDTYPLRPGDLEYLALNSLAFMLMLSQSEEVLSQELARLIDEIRPCCDLFAWPTSGMGKGQFLENIQIYRRAPQDTPCQAL